jgi:cell division protein FtsI/penicillin-binding protein 2
VILWDMIYQQEKRKYTWFQNVQTHVPNGGWRSTTIISNSIGQGEVLMTPIQLASMMATVANEGYYYTPHIIKKN